MINASETRDLIAKFIDDEYSFDEFENRFIGQSWNIRKLGDIESQVLSYAIELTIAEYQHAALSYEELRSELKSLANTFVNVGQSHFVGTASTTQLRDVLWPVVPADSSRATAFWSPTRH